MEGEPTAARRLATRAGSCRMKSGGRVERMTSVALSCMTGTMSASAARTVSVCQPPLPSCVPTATITMSAEAEAPRRSSVNWQLARRDPVGDEFREPRLMERDPSLAQAAETASVGIDAQTLVLPLGQACTRDQPNVAQADYGDTHSSIPPSSPRPRWLRHPRQPDLPRMASIQLWARLADPMTTSPGRSESTNPGRPYRKPPTSQFHLLFTPRPSQRSCSDGGLCSSSGARPHQTGALRRYLRRVGG